MRTRGALVFCVAILAALVTVPALSVHAEGSVTRNLLAMSGFEHANEDGSPAGWHAPAGDAWRVEPDAARSGTSGARAPVSAITEGARLSSGLHLVWPDATYALDVWVRALAPFPDGVMVGVVYSDAAGEAVGDAGVGLDMRDAGEWARLRVDAVAPPDAVFAEVVIFVRPGSALGTIDVDDVTLTGPVRYANEASPPDPGAGESAPVPAAAPASADPPARAPAGAGAPRDAGADPAWVWVRGVGALAAVIVGLAVLSRRRDLRL